MGLWNRIRRIGWVIALVMTACCNYAEAIEFNDTIVVDSGVVVVTVPEEEWDFEMPVDSAREDSIQKLNQLNFNQFFQKTLRL